MSSSASPPTGLKCTPPGGGDVSQDRPGGLLYQLVWFLVFLVSVIKNSLRKSSRNSGALLILTVLGCISGYHVDALHIEKHDALVTCGKLFFCNHRFYSNIPYKRHHNLLLIRNRS